MRILILLLMPVLAFAAPSPEEQAINQMLAVMTPIHEQWVQETTTLAEQTDVFCSKGKKLDALREQWRLTQLSWNALSTFSIGPLTENGYLYSQVQYWPDKKNLVQFQMRDTLRRQMLEQLDVTQLSVAMRGLSASEFILFDAEVKLEQAAERKRYCPLLLSNARYQQKLAQQVRQEWQEYQPALQVPTQRYANNHEVLTDWLRVNVAALEMLHKKIALPLGGLAGNTKTQGKAAAQPYQAEFWRSGQSIASLRGALNVQQQIWQQGWKPLVQAQDAVLAKKIDEKFVQIQQSLQSIKSPMPKLLADKQQLAVLLNVYQQLADLRSLYDAQVAKVLGIQIGFNANDGD